MYTKTSIRYYLELFRILFTYFNKLLQYITGHDQRLERTMESSLMVMEALEGYSQMIRYEIMVSEI
jgi:hypothetical protein